MTYASMHKRLKRLERISFMAGRVARRKAASMRIKQPVPIENLRILKRTYNSLKASDINTIDELKDKSKVELLRLPGVGRKSLDDLICALAEFNTR